MTQRRTAKTFKVVEGPKFLSCPKYLAWTNISKKRQKLLFRFGNVESELLNFCIEFDYSFRQTL